MLRESISVEEVGVEGKGVSLTVEKSKLYLPPATQGFNKKQKTNNNIDDVAVFLCWLSLFTGVFGNQKGKKERVFTDAAYFCHSQGWLSKRLITHLVFFLVR